MVKVMCFGTFDVLHPGHIDYFLQAKEHGEYLIVVVARDKSVREEKLQPPLYSESERVGRVKDQKLVDAARLGNIGDKLKVIEEEKPDVLCIGYDQRVDEEKLKAALAERGLTPTIIRAKSYQPEKYKSSILKTQ